MKINVYLATTHKTTKLLEDEEIKIERNQSLLNKSVKFYS